jgi:hypothetical protein
MKRGRKKHMDGYHEFMHEATSKYHLTLAKKYIEAGSSHYGFCIAYVSKVWIVNFKKLIGRRYIGIDLLYDR